MRSNQAHLEKRGIGRLPTRPSRVKPSFRSVSLLFCILLLASAARAEEEPRALFEEATTLMETGACDGALPLYDDLVARFPAAPEAPLALYNAGRCHERAEDLDAALQRYDAVLSGYRSHDAATDARFRRGLVLMELERPQEALREFLRLERAGSATTIREVAVLDAQIGACQATLGRSRLATRRLVPALEALESIDPLEDPDARWYVAQVHVAMGDLLADGARRVSLQGRDHDQVRERLQRRTDLVVQARDHYAAAAAEDAPLWACAAGYKLGRLYEGYLEAVAEIPAPAVLDPAQQQVFLQVLLEEVAHYQMAAVTIYQETLDYAAMTGVENRWVRRTLERLEGLDLEGVMEAEGL